MQSRRLAELVSDGIGPPDARLRAALTLVIGKEYARPGISKAEG